MNAILGHILIFFVAAVAAVLICKRLGLGSVLGYLLAGLIIGPWGLGLILDGEVILHFAEFGVVLLLFLIGLELKPRRLWELRRSILGAGSAQLLASAVVLGLGLWLWDYSARSAIVAGLVLALSSTAFALQIIEERGWSDTITGRVAFAILLFQDIAVIPMLAVIPILGKAEAPVTGVALWTSIGQAAAVIAATLVIGPRLAKPLFRLVAATGSRELFTALSLGIVCAMALIVDQVGMSMALGAFMGGVLLADSEYRHQLEIDIEPFKGLLMGLFFMAVGMSMDVGLCLREPLLIVTLTVAVIATKFLVLYVLGRVLGLRDHQPWQLAGVLCQGGEFGFVLFGAAAAAGVMLPERVAILSAVIVLSMALTPLVLAVCERLVQRALGRAAPSGPPQVDDPGRPVIIAGFGRYGQVIGRMLQAHGFATTLIDRDPDQIELAARFGSVVHYGDATRLDMLEAAGADRARLLVVALDDPIATRRVVDLAQKHFPALPLVVRVRNRSEVFEMMDRGIETYDRETFAAALNSAGRALGALGFDAARAQRAVDMFGEHDQSTIAALHAVRGDDRRYLSVNAVARDDLERLMQAEQDARQAAAGAEGGVVQGS